MMSSKQSVLLLSESDSKQSLPNVIFKCRNWTTSTGLLGDRIWTQSCLPHSLPSLFFSHPHFLPFQTPDVRMAVICCFKTVTQSHSLIFTTRLEILCSTVHAPSNKKRDFGHLSGGGPAGSWGQNIRTLWASCQGLSRCYTYSNR